MKSEESSGLPRREFLAGAFASGVAAAGPVRADEQNECLFYEFTDRQVENIIRDWGDDLSSERVRILQNIESGRADTNYVYSTPDGDFYDNGVQVEVSDAFTSDMIYIYYESKNRENYFTDGGEVGCERVPFERSTETTTVEPPETTETPATTEPPTTTKTPTTTEEITPTTARDASTVGVRETTTTAEATSTTSKPARRDTKSTAARSESSDEFVIRLPTGGLPTEVIAAGLSAVAVLLVQQITGRDS